MHKHRSKIIETSTWKSQSKVDSHQQVSQIWS